MIVLPLLDMVERVPWFSPADYEILAFFETHDIESSPKVIAVNIGYDRQYISKRCRILEKAHILEKSTSKLYQLSKKGNKLISGNVSANEIKKPTE